VERLGPNWIFYKEFLVSSRLQRFEEGLVVARLGDIDPPVPVLSYDFEVGESYLLNMVLPGLHY